MNEDKFVFIGLGAIVFLITLKIIAQVLIEKYQNRSSEISRRKYELEKEYESLKKELINEYDSLKKELLSEFNEALSIAENDKKNWIKKHDELERQRTTEQKQLRESLVAECEAEKNLLKREKQAWNSQKESERNSLIKERQALNSEKEDFKKSLEIEIEKFKTALETEITEHRKAKNTYESAIREFEKAIKEKCEYYPYLAAIMSDLLTLHYNRAAYYLEHKQHPAHTEAQRIRELRAETKQIIKEKKELEYQLAYIRKIIPNVDDIFDSGYIDDGITKFEAETEETTDRVRLYLEVEEYQKMTPAQRNQLALDRYVAGRKSKWQIGRDYEMYIGYLYEEQGCSVEYMGIIKGLEDLGRDLIVKKDGKTTIVQCKNWSKEKTIHEKHIFQLFGTVVLYNVEHPNANAKGVFISTTALSETALKIADELNIQVVRREHGEFPRIKCNINRSTGEKIYHLPFDQQYDTAIINKKQGEFYAKTTAEAERKGFRRAFRHYG